jgi:hypothetical protein
MMNVLRQRSNYQSFILHRYADYLFKIYPSEFVSSHNMPLLLAVCCHYVIIIIIIIIVITTTTAAAAATATATNTAAAAAFI